MLPPSYAVPRPPPETLAAAEGLPVAAHWILHGRKVGAEARERGAHRQFLEANEMGEDLQLPPVLPASWKGSGALESSVFAGESPLAAACFP